MIEKETIPREDSKPTKEDWVYAAATIDCEGCVGLSRSTNYNRKREKYYAFCPYVIVGNTNKLLIDWLRDTFGFGYVQKRKRKPKKHKEVWLWRLGNKGDITYFLSGVLPYLKMKNKQAEVLTEYFKRWHHNDPAWRDENYLILKKLNRRGKPVETNTQDNPATGLKIESDPDSDIGKQAEMTCSA